MFNRPSSLPTAPSVPVSGKLLKMLFKSCSSLPDDVSKSYLKDLQSKSTLTASRKIDRDLQLLVTTSSPDPTRPILVLSTVNKYSSSVAVPTVYSISVLISQLLSATSPSPSPIPFALPIAITNSFVESKIKNGAKKLYKGGIHRYHLPASESSSSDPTPDAPPPSPPTGSACLVVSRGMLVATGVIDENMEVVIWSTFEDVLWKTYCDDFSVDCVVMDWDPQEDECEEEEEEEEGEENQNEEGGEGGETKEKTKPDAIDIDIDIDPNTNAPLSPPPPPSTEGASIQTGPDATRLLYDTMLNLAAYSSNATLKLPLLTSTLYSSHLLPLLVLASPTFNLKDTVWKKFGVFLAEVGFVNLKEKSPGVIEVTRIDRSHPDIRSHKRENPSILPQEITASAGGNSTDGQTVVRKVELYVFSKELRTAANINPEEITASASTVERRGTEYLTKSEVTAFLKPILEASANNGVVTITPQLAIYGLELNSTKKQKPLMDVVLKKLKPAHAIAKSSNGSTRVVVMKHGSARPAIIRCQRRGGNKYITKIEELKQYVGYLEVPMQAIVEEIKSKLSCSVTIGEADTVVIGGKLHREVYEILTKDKTKYNCEHGGLTGEGSWRLGKELVKVETQKGIKG
ncbi:hypothetical protein TrLO_g8931 [Triparma laevis f. longispina]|uniref:SUI1 domain-containing protein n=1 Tax=Triparma laevis f. longispina TaxID=1714387 RepID=A0A9W7FV47_9STRA|nr:hypothetical protein TrLO_g8931 [Triparma laevis f. longispina]